jgi:hypothetical protein
MFLMSLALTLGCGGKDDDDTSGDATPSDADADADGGGEGGGAFEDFVSVTDEPIGDLSCFSGALGTESPAAGCVA